MHSNSGRTRAKAAASPPTMIDREACSTHVSARNRRIEELSTARASGLSNLQLELGWAGGHVDRDQPGAAASDDAARPEKNLAHFGGESDHGEDDFRVGRHLRGLSRPVRSRSSSGLAREAVRLVTLTE